MTDGLQCECVMPLAWREAVPSQVESSPLLREAALLLAAINQMEGSHEPEPGNAENRRLDRLEAKLDLTLHLLARALANAPAPAMRRVRLGVDRLEWEDDAPPPADTPLILELRPSEALPLTLSLPALAQPPGPGQGRARLTGLGEALEETLTQFIFRRHRQAIRARSG
ncbi:MAG: PilZ domain-containing protein [Pseudomonadota bacterium]